MTWVLVQPPCLPQQFTFPSLLVSDLFTKGHKMSRLIKWPGIAVLNGAQRIYSVMVAA